MKPTLDLVTLGRSSVDLYGQQIGGRLEDMASFAKSVGGSPTNTAIGAARLGLASAVITAVGDEHMGRFIREQLAREGVDTRGVKTDPARLTALVLLGVQDSARFPLIFYRENCADMGLREEDVDPDLVASARALCLSGTHLSTPTVHAASMKALEAAEGAGRRIALDVDYRPNLWGLAGHGAGESRYIRSDTVTAHLQTVLPRLDLVVGTEEEVHILGGSEDTRTALLRIRELSAALIVLKRGPMGCIAFPGAIPEDLETGVKGPGFPVEVYNVLGAGDAFMAGFLRGWLRDEPLETACTYANACGAFAVSRLLCSPEYPTFRELASFLERGSATPALRLDRELGHLHRVGTRRPTPPGLVILDTDPVRAAGAAEEAGGRPQRLRALPRLALDAVLEVARERPAAGMLFHASDAREALFAAGRHPLWIGRSAARPAAGPASFEPPDLGSALAEWPSAHTLHVAARLASAPSEAARQAEIGALVTADDACRRSGRDYLVELADAEAGTDLPALLDRLYGAGVRPDWWALAPQPHAAGWKGIAAAIARGDPDCRGILLVLPAGEGAAAESALALARRCAPVEGLILPLPLTAAPLRAWLGGGGDAGAATASIAAFVSEAIAAFARSAPA